MSPSRSCARNAWPVWVTKCGTSMTVSGSVHSSTSVPPMETSRNAFLARSTTCGQRMPRKSSTNCWLTSSGVIPAIINGKTRGSESRGVRICLSCAQLFRRLARRELHRRAVSILARRLERLGLGELLVMPRLRAVLCPAATFLARLIALTAGPAGIAFVLRLRAAALRGRHGDRCERGCHDHGDQLEFHLRLLWESR